MATGKAVATLPSRGRLAQVSLARLLGVCEPCPAGMTLTLNMSASSSSGPPPAPVAASADTELAAHERVRAKKRKAPEGPRGRSKASRTTMEAKNVSKDHRLSDFPNQGLKVSAGDLFCQPCATTLPNIKGSIIHHLQTKKHKIKLEAFQKRQAADMEVRTELSEYFDANKDERQVHECAAHPLSRTHKGSLTPMAHLRRPLSTPRFTCCACELWKPFWRLAPPCRGWSTSAP